MTLLLLAGTGEAKRIAWSLADSGRAVIASLAAAMREPDTLPVPTRIGGFGGEAGFRAFLAAERISAVLDATHPFAAQITNRTARACAALDMPYCQLLRPAWVPGLDDDWREVASAVDVPDLIPPNTTVFLATGRQRLADFAGLAGRRVIARVVEPPKAPFPFEGGEFLIGRPPYMEERDRQLMAALGVDWLVTKNAGGAGGVGKLRAARRLGIPVVMLGRPEMPDAPRVESVAQALDWVAAL